ncbi:MAG: TonB-dependent receptor [Cryomorphaceae bacterium]|nr:TonB-dependent receptor [Cryomorphaceae bacterium]
MNRILLILSALLFSTTALAQSAKLTGTVVDGSTGETMPGAQILVEGTSLTTLTNFDGLYSLSLAPGTYTIVVKSFGFSNKAITGVVVRAGSETSLNITMELSKGESLDEVTITASAVRENVNALFIQQKSLSSVSDGISSETIRRTPDRNTGDVLKRVSGASIQDNKFAIVRGLSDRYNAAYLNGAPLPSTESDRKAFAFDVFPAALLDNLVIVKTASAELPGEFAGGVIQVNTKSFPGKAFHEFSFSTGYNSLTTFKNRLDYQGSSTDWLGLDNGARALPKGMPTSNEMFLMSSAERVQVASKFQNDWGLQNKMFLPSVSMQYSGGGSKELGTTKRLGFIYALTYNQNNQYNTTQRQSWQNEVGMPGTSLMESDLNDDNYIVNTLAGALANLTYSAGPNTTIGWKNLYSITSQDRVLMRNGTRQPIDAPNQVIRQSARWFTNNQIVSSQLNGSHYFESFKGKFQWLGAYSGISRSVPNLRNTLYYGDTDVADTAWRAGITSTSVGPDYSGSRFYGLNLEGITSGQATFEMPVDFVKIGLRNNLKLGAGAQYRDRSYTARQFGYVLANFMSFDQSLLNQPIDGIFGNDNMNATTGFSMREGTKSSDSYLANAMLGYGFVQFDTRIMEKTRINWGVRAENFEQNLYSKTDNNDTVQVESTKLDFLPSVNFIYSINDAQNLRLSYSRTLNRPEFRELAPFAFYDFQTRYVVTGNPSLVRSTIDNFDARYEWYPGKGQVLSVTGFYKNFTNPIEQATREDVVTEYTYVNVPKAVDYGLELEGRLLLSTLFGAADHAVWSKLTVFANYALIRSRVTLNSATATDSVRPLQGQSPYVINAGIQYQNEESGTTISAAFNQVGDRIFIVGSSQEPSVWEKGRAVLDLSFNQEVNKKLSLKLTARDLLTPDLIFYNDIDANQTWSEGDDQMWRTNFGPTVTFGLTYQL